MLQKNYEVLRTTYEDFITLAKENKEKRLESDLSIAYGAVFEVLGKVETARNL